MPQSTRRRLLLVVISTLVGLVASACSSSGQVAAPSTTTSPKATKAPAEIIKAASSLAEVHAVDTRAMDLPVVGGVTRHDPVGVTGGHARLSGTVTFDGRPLAEATVRLERYAGGSMGSVELRTDAHGAWVAKGVVGGRYVVRAWKRPNLALERARALFLDDRGQEDLALPLVGVVPGDVTVSVSVDPDPPRVDASVDLAISVRFEHEKTSDPVPNIAVTFVDFPEWDLAQGIADLTDAKGEARWRAVCTSPGAHTVEVDVAGTSHTLHMPKCLPPKQSSETTTTTTSDAGGGR